MAAAPNGVAALFSGGFGKPLFCRYTPWWKMRCALDLWKQVKAVNAQKHLLFQLLILHVQLGDLTNAVQSIAQSVAVNMHSM